MIRVLILLSVAFLFGGGFEKIRAQSECGTCTHWLEHPSIIHRHTFEGNGGANRVMTLDEEGETTVTRRSPPDGEHAADWSGSCYNGSRHLACEDGGDLLSTVQSVVRRSEAARTHLLARMGLRVVVNARRNAVQVYDCNGTRIVAHFPLNAG